MATVHAQRITPENFAPYGRIVQTPAGMPTAESPEFRFWSDIASYHVEGETEIGLCTVFRQPKAVVQGVERHGHTPEILIPIDGPFILPVLSEDAPEKGLQAFRVNVGEAVVIRDGIWHGACLPAESNEATYFVIFRKHTPQSDVVKKTIGETSVVW